MLALVDDYHYLQAYSSSMRLFVVVVVVVMKAKTCLLREIKSFWLCNRHGWNQTSVWVHVESEGELHEQG